MIDNDINKLLLIKIESAIDIQGVFLHSPVCFFLKYFVNGLR